MKIHLGAFESNKKDTCQKKRDIPQVTSQNLMLKKLYFII